MNSEFINSAIRNSRTGIRVNSEYVHTDLWARLRVIKKSQQKCQDSPWQLVNKDQSLNFYSVKLEICGSILRDRKWGENNFTQCSFSLKRYSCNGAFSYQSVRLILVTSNKKAFRFKLLKIFRMNHLWTHFIIKLSQNIFSLSHANIYFIPTRCQ